MKRLCRFIGPPKVAMKRHNSFPLNRFQAMKRLCRFIGARKQCWGSESESESERIRMFWRIRIRIRIRSNRSDSDPDPKGSEYNFTHRKMCKPQKSKEDKKNVLPVLRIRIRDPVPFGPLDPGSGIGFFRIPDPTITSESLKTIFLGIKIL